MFSAFAHSELQSLVRPYVGIAANTLTAGNTVYTASASPQPAAGIDTWQSGKTMFRNLLIIVDVAVITAGTLTISLRDYKDAITTANVAASTYEVASFSAISAAGLYVAELIFEHVFPATLARVVADADNDTVRRYHTLKAVAAGGDSTFAAIMLYGFNKRDFPTRATNLTTTWTAT